MWYSVSVSLSHPYTCFIPRYESVRMRWHPMKNEVMNVEMGAMRDTGCSIGPTLPCISYPQVTSFLQARVGDT